MAIITIPFTYSAGAVIIASQHNTCNSTIYGDYNGNIDNSNIVAAAGIVYSKLNLTGGILNADVSASAAIVASKLDLTSPGAIGSTAASTGAFSTLKVGTTHQGDILYDNGTSLIRLTPGTSGQFLKTQGASANPIWSNGPALVFVSNTTVTTAANTGDIAITATNRYKVIFNFNSMSGDDVFLVRFNNSSSGVYQFAFGGRVTGGASTGGGTAQTSITISPTMLASGDNTTNGEFTIYPQFNSNIIHMSGQLVGISTTEAVINFSGYFSGAAVTSFRILSSGGATFSGNVILYQLSTS